MFFSDSCLFFRIKGWLHCLENIGSSISLRVMDGIHMAPIETCAIGDGLGIQVFALRSTGDGIKSAGVSLRLGVNTGFELETAGKQEV